MSTIPQKNITVAQLVKEFFEINVEKNGPVELIFDDKQIPIESFSDSEGFLPIVVSVGEALERVHLSARHTKDGEPDPQPSLISSVAAIEESPSSALGLKVVEKGGVASIFAPGCLYVSAALESLLDAEKNPYIKMVDNVRQVDVMAMLLDVSAIHLSLTEKTMSINKEAIQQIFEKEAANQEPQAMEQ